MSLCPHGYTAFWDCPTCEYPMGTRNEPRADLEAPDELKLCSRCGSKAGFSWDAEQKDWVSSCCGWPAVQPDYDPF